MTQRFLLILIILSFFSCNERKTPADLIFKGGKIYTTDEKNPVVEAVAVIGDTIAYAGDLAGLKKFEGEKTHVVDLQGKMMTPGFIEAHGHLMALGFSELSLDLSTIKNYDEMVDKVKTAVANAKPGQWIVGWGWHQEKWDHKPAKTIKGFQTQELLSSVSPDNPVVLRHASGHALFANAKAMQIAGVNVLAKEKTIAPQENSGEIIRDDLGNPTGIFTENTQRLISDHIPPSTPEQSEQALQLALAACLKNGITSFQDAGTSQDVLDLLKKNKSEGKLSVRLYEMLTGEDKKLIDAWYLKGPEIDPTHWLTIRAIKLHCDGALGSRGAWLLEPYSDRPNHYGNETLPMEAVLTTSRQALTHDFQVCSHAIGDRTNREVLDRYEIAFKENPTKAKDARFRIEHVQHLNPSDIPRFSQLGVIASMQTTHLSSDRPWAIERLGEKRIVEGAYMWQSLIRSGAKVINGTDVPVEPINPIASFYSAVTRKTLLGKPEGGYEPDQKMTREQALNASTLEAAFGAFEERLKGSIQRGKLADFTIFSQDMMTIPEDQILKTNVQMTIVGGKISYEKK